jgi:hypothetical protein
VTLTLDHNDDALCVPLYAASDSDNIAAVWKAWGRVLRLPLLVAESDGAVREAIASLGAVTHDDPQPRRRRRSAIKRRPRVATRFADCLGRRGEPSPGHTGGCPLSDRATPGQPAPR